MKCKKTNYCEEQQKLRIISIISAVCFFGLWLVIGSPFKILTSWIGFGSLCKCYLRLKSGTNKTKKENIYLIILFIGFLLSVINWIYPIVFIAISFVLEGIVVLFELLHPLKIWIEPLANRFLS